MKHSLIKTTIIASALMLSSFSAYAVDEYNVTSGITTAGAALGVHGVDTVALSSSGNAVDGTAAYTTVHDGVAYYFASEESQGLFEKSPDAYLPQFGGFCAYAVSLGKKFDGNPKFADIVKGELFLFVNEAVFQEYKKSPAKVIATAREKWTDIHHKAVSSL